MNVHAVRDDLVFTERVDRFTIGGKRVVVRVAGVFEVRDGQTVLGGTTPILRRSSVNLE